MTKSKVIKKYEEELADRLEFDDDFGFSDDLPDADAFAGVMGGLIDANNHQATIAMELTKLIIEKSSDQSISEDKIFATFKRASKVVYDSFPLKSLFEQGL